MRANVWNGKQKVSAQELEQQQAQEAGPDEKCALLAPDPDQPDARDQKGGERSR